MLEINSPRDAVVEAYRSKIISDRELWEQMIKDRNISSHTYDEADALEIHGRIQKQYAPAFRAAFDAAKQHFKKVTS